MVGGVLGLALIIGAIIMFVKSRNRIESAVEQKGAASSSEAINVPAAEPEGSSKTVITANSKLGRKLGFHSMSIDGKLRGVG